MLRKVSDYVLIFFPSVAQTIEAQTHDLTLNIGLQNQTYFKGTIDEVRSVTSLLHIGFGKRNCQELIYYIQHQTIFQFVSITICRKSVQMTC